MKKEDIKKVALSEMKDGAVVAAYVSRIHNHVMVYQNDEHDFYVPSLIIDSVEKECDERKIPVGRATENSLYCATTYAKLYEMACVRDREVFTRVPIDLNGDDPLPCK